MRFVLVFLAIMVVSGQVTALARSNHGSPPQENGTAKIDKVPAGANTEISNDLDSVMEGFDDTDSELPAPSPDPVYEKPSWWDITGYVTGASSYNYAHGEPNEGQTDYRGLSRLRLKTGVELTVDPYEGWKAKLWVMAFYDLAYTINDRDNYTGQVIENYESEARVKEAYIQGRLNRYVDIKIGRQIVVWGKSDNIRLTDILNPMDNREPGMVDIEDIREPIFMSRIDFYYGPWNLTTIAIHEIRFNYNPVYGSDFYPGDSPSPEERTPASSLGNTEYALALNGIFSGWDISFYWADVFNDQAHIVSAGGAPPDLTLRHARVKMIGVSANVAYGSWLFKTEAARFEGLEYFNADNAKSRHDLLAGVEYTGITDKTVSAEFVVRHIEDFSAAMANAPDSASENEYQTVIRYQADYLHDTAHILALISFLGLGGEDGGFQRVSVKYDVNDYISITTGAVTYQSGDNYFFSGVEENDRVFLDIKYSF